VTIQTERDGPASPLLGRIANLLNGALEFDEKTRHRLVVLGSCSIAFRLRGADHAVIVNVRDGELALTQDIGVKSDVQIEGGFADFVAMAQTQRDGTTLAAGKIEIQGDLATAQQIQTLIAEASFDWEEMIARQTGDIFARQFARGLRGASRWAAATRAVLERDISEYLRHELRLLPTATEIERLVEDGAALVADVDRLGARFARMRRKRDAK